MPMSNGTRFSALFGPGDVICRSDRTDRDGVLRDLLQLLSSRHPFDAEQALGEIVARAEQEDVFLAPGVAVPHARLDFMNRMVVGIATSEKGISFRPGAPADIRLVVAMLVPKAEPSTYLRALSSLAGLCAKENLVERMSALESGAEVWRFFDRGGVVLPDYVCAADIMDRDVVSVFETDTLERAIDLLVKHDVGQLPVVDKNGELVGVVSDLQLLKICLPEYVLWLDDMSPVINFEPFTQVLEKEARTSLAEIMSEEVAEVSENAPAMQVAKEMTRFGTRCVFVLQGRKLVGVVTSRGFVEKVLRI